MGCRVAGTSDCGSCTRFGQVPKWAGRKGRGEGDPILVCSRRFSAEGRFEFLANIRNEACLGISAHGACVVLAK